ncbi:ricin-type beta-trefoil lectin domain protein [Streptomyces sporangiiformans]|uniref:Hydrolase n=1 Tax=Streptomyces sporangiiformans TaxID=2315329 RepID=A0A505DJZ1_9ACTN|nr:ricin-type beta-trefoil lectin domain protein [Streptomyces sporangiiformans]TPQ22755.1 hydrolase [Streptomyces sporangiiformans]
MSDATPSNSRTHARQFDATDEELTNDLRRNSSGEALARYPSGELLARHWVAVHSYARLCTNGAQYAGMLTTAAFTRLFGQSARQSGPTAAWRPRLLVTVRRIAAEWAMDNRRTLLHPGLQPGPDGGDRAAARLLPPENRRLVVGAFQQLPEAARCILWHAEVEAEDLAIPAGLLGLTPQDVPIRLERARALLRRHCLESHRELAPEGECHRYSRLLDASLRGRGVSSCPDLREHLDRCRHCRYTADQVDHSGDRLALLLAEALLVWGAQDYLDSRPGRRGPMENAHAGPVVAVSPGPEPWAAAPDDGHGTAPDDGLGSAPDDGHGTAPDDVLGSAPDDGHGTAPDDVLGSAPVDGHGTAPDDVLGSAPDDGHATAPGNRTWSAARLPVHPDNRPVHPDNRPVPPANSPREPRKGPRRGSPHRDRRNPALAVLSLTVLAVSTGVLVPLVLWSGGGDDAEPPADASTGTASEGPGAQPSRAGTADASPGILSGRLRHAESGLCVGIDDGKVTEGAEAELATCTSADRQQWSYESDGSLRSLAVSELCLDSRLASSVRLGQCEGEEKTYAENVRYDFTLQGSLVPLGRQELALTPASTESQSDLVLKARDDGKSQRWLIDPSEDSLQMEWITAYTDGDSPEPTRSAVPTPTPTPSSTPARGGP